MVQQTYQNVEVNTAQIDPNKSIQINSGICATAWLQGLDSHLQLQKQLDGCYIRKLGTVMVTHQSQQVSNEDLYQDLPRLSKKIGGKRLPFAVCCQRGDDELVSMFLLYGNLDMYSSREDGKSSVMKIP